LETEMWHDITMGSKDHQKREVRKPKKKEAKLLSPTKSTAPREDYNKAAFRAVQETFRKSES